MLVGAAQKNKKKNSFLKNALYPLDLLTRRPDSIILFRSLLFRKSRPLRQFEPEHLIEPEKLIEGKGTGRLVDFFIFFLILRVGRNRCGYPCPPDYHLPFFPAGDRIP